MIKGKCPNCGKALELPEELEEFSCLYCGSRMTMENFVAFNSKVQEAVDWEADPEYVRLHLIDAVKKYPRYFEKIGRDTYVPAFEAYEKGNAQLLQMMDRVACGQTDNGKQWMTELCDTFIQELETEMTADPRWKKAGKSTVLFENKLMLALFLTPLAKKLELQSAGLFCTELHRQWMLHWPKELWQPGDYQRIVDGYKKKRLCFITTAVCEQEGKPDNCEELTAFRAFRDSWLTEHNGTELIREYYDVAPEIVVRMELCDDSADRCAEIRRRWLGPCYELLQAEKMEECRDVYVEMVRTLQHRYHLN